MPLVFVYGPETVQAKMYDRIGPSKCLGPALAEGYRLAFSKPNRRRSGEGLANLDEDPNAQAFGLLFDLKPAQLEILDGFFGGYGRTDVRVKPVGADSSRKVGTWTAQRSRPNLKPTRANLETTIQGMEENEADPAFIEEVKALEVLDE